MAIIKRGDKGSALTYEEMDGNFDAIAPRDSATGAIQIPTGTSSEVPSSPQTGMFRYNTSANSFEGYSGGVWSAIAGGGGGGGQTNQNAWSEFIVSGQNTVAADQATDSVTLVAGTNMTITTDSGADSITFNAAFSQDFAYSSLTGAPAVPSDLLDLGITDGTVNQVLRTDGAGNFSFVNQSGGGTQGVQGLSGLQGPLGTTLQGTQGTAGTPGTPGTPGADGDPGVQGPAGSIQGLQGITGSGIQGTAGADGDGNQGAQGTQGLTGSGGQGDPGEIGAQGFQGFQGPAGSAQGLQGLQGNFGPPGLGIQGLQGGGGQGVQGLQGNLGPAGFGAQGHQGVQGNDGPLGPPGAGAQGTQGTAGSTQGIQGIEGDGIQGFQGFQGPSGTTQGIQGNAGIGDDGAQGIQGTSVQGLTGFGVQGIQGTDGIQGLQGIQGLDGFGIQGLQGTTGTQGFQGVTLQGLQGEAIQGTQGAQGAAGAEGDEGAQGIQGTNLQGVQGIQGISFQGIQGNEGLFGQQGTQGAQGLEAQGIQGQRGEIGPSGGAQGVQGFNGIQGPSDGATGAQGLQGISQAGTQGLQGTLGVQGDTGIQGPSNGPQGTQGVQGVLGLQGLDGSGAQGIQGVIGIQGPSDGATGADGADGPQGVQGVLGLQGPSDGADGAQGLQGLQGLTGSGAQGIQGTNGNLGLQGIQGLDGLGGAAGNNGVQGLQGLIGTGTLDNLVDDTTPQLGGNLDLQSFYLGSAAAHIAVSGADLDITGQLDLNSNQIKTVNSIGLNSGAYIDSTSATYSNIKVGVNANGSRIDLVQFGGDPVTPANPNLADTGTLFTEKVWIDANADQQFDLYDVVNDTADITSDAGIYMNFKATTGLGAVQTRASIWHQNNMLRMTAHDASNANPQSNYQQLKLGPILNGSVLQLTSVVAGAATNYEVTTEYNAMTHIAQNMEYLSNPVRFNKIDTTARDALTSQAEGNMIYNTTTDQVEIYNGSGWENIAVPSIDDNGNATAMTIDASENVMVGTTTYNGPANATTGDYGAALWNSGLIAAGTNASEALVLNRMGSDGDIAVFKRSGTTVGSIGVASNDNLYIAGGSGNTKGLYFNDSGVVPANTGGAPQDNASDLGAPSVRFKDAYLSGGVHLGGTGAANKLDDYEEGTWTPLAKGTTTNPTVAPTLIGRYTKIGNQVNIYLKFDAVSFAGAAGGVYFDGLPFSAIGTPVHGIGSIMQYNVCTFNDSPCLYVSGSAVYIYHNVSGSTWANSQHTGSSTVYMNACVTYTTTS